MVEKDWKSLELSRNSRHDSFHAASLWRVTFVPALGYLLASF